MVQRSDPGRGWSDAHSRSYRAVGRSGTRLRDIRRIGAPGGTRTHGLLLRRQTLYPLSYGRALGRFNQMGTSGARALARKLRTWRRGLPEDGHAADEGAIVAGQRERRRLAGPVNAVEAAHREAPIVGAPEAQGADERQIVEGDGRARLGAEGERLRPLGQGHRSDLVEAQTEELLGRLVVEEGVARRVGEEDGQREVARDLAGGGLARGGGGSGA